MMTDQDDIYSALLSRKTSTQDFLRQVLPEGKDPHEEVIARLENALARRDANAVERAMIVGSCIGYNADFVSVLISLSHADWHNEHEDVVFALGELRDVRSIEALYMATKARHEYLNYSDAEPLAVRAIWALGGIPGRAANEKLIALSTSENDILREEALLQLERRRSRE